MRTLSNWWRKALWFVQDEPFLTVVGVFVVFVMLAVGTNGYKERKWQSYQDACELHALETNATEAKAVRSHRGFACFARESGQWVRVRPESQEVE